MTNIYHFQSKKDKYKALYDAPHLDVHLFSGHPSFKKLIHELYRGLKDNGYIQGHEKLIRRQIGVLICNLFRANVQGKGWLAIDRGKNAYSSGEHCRYKGGSRVTFKLVEVVDAFIKAGHVYQEMGFSDQDLGGRKTRIKCTAKLRGVFDEYGASTDWTDTPSTQECIILKKTRKIADRSGTRHKIKELACYTDNREINSRRRKLTAYNNLLRNTLIWIPPLVPVSSVSKAVVNGDEMIGRENEHGYPFDGLATFTKRIFNDDFEHGGRYYGNGWVNLPKEWRQRIRIDNEETAEIDYTSNHLVLLYAYAVKRDYWAECGYEQDPYTLERTHTVFSKKDHENARTLLKTFFTVATNTESKQQCINALEKKEEYKELEPWLNKIPFSSEDLIDKFLAQHSPIREHMFSSMGTRLQNIDSRISEWVIDDCTKREICVLNIHDSNIAQLQHVPFLENRMKCAHRDILEEITQKKFIDPKVKIRRRPQKERDLDQFVDIDRAYEREREKFKKARGRNRNYYKARSLPVRKKHV